MFVGSKLKPILSAITVLEGMTDQDLELLQQRSRWRKVLPGHNLLSHSTEATSVFFLCEGEMIARIITPSGREVGIANLRSGDIVGEMAVLSGQPRLADVMADSECVVAELSAEDFLNLLADHPIVTRNLLIRANQIIVKANQRITGLVAANVNDRVNSEIFRIATTTLALQGEDETRALEDILINPAPSHERIANFAGTTREAVTKQLAYLSKNKILSHKRGQIIIHDLEALRSMISQRMGDTG